MLNSNRTRAKIKTDLRGVSATALLTLNERATFAEDVRSEYSDPVAIAVRDRIDCSWDAFGKAHQGSVVRATTFDASIADFCSDHPEGVIVALGEGLQTTYWRRGDESLRWFSVDLPELVELRQTLMPRSENVVHIARSAFDTSWMDRIPVDAPVLIVAEGLFSYFEFELTTELMRSIVRRFPGGRTIFDINRPWMSRAVGNGAQRGGGYRTPSMPGCADDGQLRRFVSSLGPGSSLSMLQPLGGTHIWGTRSWRLPGASRLRPIMASIGHPPESTDKADFGA